MFGKKSGPVMMSLAMAAIFAVAGCGQFDNLISLFGPQDTTVRFINNSDFAVEGRIIIGEDQETTEELLEQLGTEISFSVDAGGTMSLSRDCDELQALLLDDANLQVIGSVGPDTRSRVLTDGSDFNCGDRITFTFDHSAQITDFDVDVTID